MRRKKNYSDYRWSAHLKSLMAHTTFDFFLSKVLLMLQDIFLIRFQKKHGLWQSMYLRKD